MVALVLDGLVGFPAGLSPTSFHLSPSSFHLSPRLFICLPHWCLWSGSRLACLPTSFHLSPTSFHLCPSSFHLSPRLGACGRVPGWLVSHFFSFVSQFFSFVSQAPTSFHLSPTSFHLSPRLGACGRVPGRLVSHFLSFVSHFFSFVSQAACGGRVPHFLSFGSACLPLPFICLPLLFCLWSGSTAACLPLAFICLPVLFICLPGCRVPGRLVSHFLVYHSVSHFLFIFCLSGWVLVVGLAALSPTSFHSRCLGRVPGRLVSHFLAFLPFPFICLPLLFICLPGWVLVRFPGGLSPTSLHLSPDFSPNSLLLGVLNSFLRRVRPLCHCWCPPISTGHVTFLFIRLPGLSLLVPALFRWPCSISIHVSPRSVTGGVRPFPLVA